MKQELCKDCVNFLSHQDNIYHCDYEMWLETEYKDAILNCAEMYECENYEPLVVIRNSFNKKI